MLAGVEAVGSVGAAAGAADTPGAAEVAGLAGVAEGVGVAGVAGAELLAALALSLAACLIRSIMLWLRAGTLAAKRKQAKKAIKRCLFMGQQDTSPARKGKEDIFHFARKFLENVLSANISLPTKLCLSIHACASALAQFR
jgi:hypothetical protein